MTEKIDGKKFELLTKWYLRFNGYFTVDNFIIHAADDSQRISNGTIGNYTDIDVMGIRMPFHFERTGELDIKNHTYLNCIEKIDIILGECKTGQKNDLNKIWKQKNIQAIEYVIRFCGITNVNDEIKAISSTLLNQFSYEDNKYRIRVILFGQKEASKEWKERGLKFISLDEILNFIIGERGQCWTKTNIGHASAHEQWDDLIKTIFKFANTNSNSKDEVKKSILEILKPTKK